MNENPLMTRGQILAVTIGCLATLVLSLLDNTIVSSVSWVMVKDLDPMHGIALLPWLTTSYALADCVVLPLYGKLSDVYGAKRVYLFALITFIFSSCLCGLAQNMVELIVFRTMQGFGAGGLMSITMVILGTLKRSEPVSAKKSSGQGVAVGMGGAVAGMSIALGPLVGGMLADSLNWRWVFYINLPLGVAALIIALVALRLPVHPVRSRIDFLGAAMFIAAATALLLVTDWGGKQYAWGSPLIILLLAAGIVLFGAFVWRAAVIEEPLISLSLLRNPVVRIMLPISLLAGAGLSGPVLYLGGYLQVGRGLTPTQASLLSLPMAAGMVASILLAKLIVGLLGKYKYLFTVAGLLQAIAMGSFAMLNLQTSYVWICFGMFIIGLGMGQTLGIGLQFLQDSVDIKDIGVATTSLRFFQQLGVSVGFALLGTVVARVLAANLTGATGAANVNGQLDTAALAQLPLDQQQAAVGVFVSATDTVFLISAGIAVLSALLSLFIKERAATTSPVGDQRVLQDTVKAN